MAKIYTMALTGLILLPVSWLLLIIGIGTQSFTTVSVGTLLLPVGTVLIVLAAINADLRAKDQEHHYRLNEENLSDDLIPRYTSESPRR